MPVSSSAEALFNKIFADMDYILLTSGFPTAHIIWSWSLQVGVQVMFVG